MSGGKGHGRKRGGGHDEEHENHERWAVSYGDMMTVLVALFIVLYAISNVDQVKYEQLRTSLASGFGQPAPMSLQGSSGPLTGMDNLTIAPEPVAQVATEVQPVDASTAVTVTATATSSGLSEGERELQAAYVEYERLTSIAERINEALAAQSLEDRVRFRVTDRGLVVGMVADDVFFSPASASLTETALHVLDTTAPVLAAVPDEISVEGHTNSIPVSGRYATNWELSSDRATQVLRRLVEVGGLAGNRIAAVGYGDARPLQGEADPISANRRVDLVILSSVPEDVRNLLPAISASDAVGAADAAPAVAHAPAAGPAAPAPPAIAPAAPEGAPHVDDH